MDDLDALVSAALAAPPALLRECLVALVTQAGPGARMHLERAAAHAAVPAPRRPAEGGGPALAEVASLVERARDLETLTRPLLEVLGDLTGLASVYLTAVHADVGLQEIRYGHDTLEGFTVPEGLHLPWTDTLCKRALDSGRAFTPDVPSVWGDSAAARDLGIRTYVSVPVRLADGSLWGTLCGADSRPAEGAERHLPTMGMIARLEAVEVQRAMAHAEARRAAEADPLTGGANRRGIEAWLEEARARGVGLVCAVYVDLDEFKAVNDTHGHAAGDAVLREVARVLRRRSRPGDLVGRIGGDEFVVAAVVEPGQVGAFLSRWQADLSVGVDLPCGRRAVRASLGTAVVPATLGPEVLAAADAAMYEVKRSRRQLAPGRAPEVSTAGIGTA